jgi:hypothetical protein
VTDDLPPATRAGALWPVISGLLRKDPGQRLDAATAERMLHEVAAVPASPPLPETPPLPATTSLPATNAFATVTL